MKKVGLYLFVFCFSNLFSQSELMIPCDAVTVFSINNLNLLQKISMDDLVQYDFMEEVHQELFDGSTSGKTLKDAGIDFKQRLNIFYGKSGDYELSGFTFGVSNSKNLFEVFDDFEELDSKYENTKVYGSFFNNLIINNNLALLIRLEPSNALIKSKTDSIWYSRGNESPFDFENDGYEDQEFDNEIFKDDNLIDEEEPNDAESEDFYTELNNPSEKNYYELRDSVQIKLQEIKLTKLLDELIIDKNNLVTVDKRLKDQLTHTCEGAFYFDNARSLKEANSLWYFQTILPSLYKDINELYSGNIILGDLFLKDQSVEFLVETKYGNRLGNIYKEMNDAKFDKNVIKYIRKTNSAYFTYNVNMRKAYEKAYEVIMPIISTEKNADIAINVMALELINELINKDALFKTYRGSMFGTFNGIKKVNTKKIIYDYDENTFEYNESEVEATEDMPIFTIGFSVGRHDIPEIVLKNLAKTTSKFEKHENYWVLNNAILDAAPLYIINKNKLFIMTNDEDLAINNSDGYKSNLLSKKSVKSLKCGGFMNAYFNIDETLNRFPSDLVDDRRSEMINSLKGKSGKFVIKSSETTIKSTSFNMTYEFNGQENLGKNLLDVINTLYIFSK